MRAITYTLGLLVLFIYIMWWHLVPEIQKFHNLVPADCLIAGAPVLGTSSQMSITQSIYLSIYRSIYNIYLSIYLSIYLYMISPYTYIWYHPCVCARVCMCVCVYIGRSCTGQLSNVYHLIYIYVRMCVCVCVYIYICKCTYVFICVCVNICNITPYLCVCLYAHA